MFNFLIEDDLENIAEALRDKTSSFDIPFDLQLELFVSKRHIPMLEKLLDFKFAKHPKFNLPNHWLDSITQFLQHRAKTVIELAERKENENL